ncbi:MAG: hypothetical protein V3U02_06400, partial [Calditrichia bacterium]
MIKKTLLALLIISCANHKLASGTAQTPDRINYDGKNYPLLSTPLQPLYMPGYSLNIDLPDFPSYFSESGITTTSTGNWRGYIATWEIENDTLFLVGVKDIKNEKSADLKEIFGDYVNDGRIQAIWYTGDLLIGKGKRKNYIHMGFMSTYEREIIIEIENGVVNSVQEYKTKNDDPPKGFQRVMTLNLIADIPKKFIACREATSDTICFKDKKGEYNIYGFANSDIENRLQGKDRQNYVAAMVDSCSQALSKNISFGPLVFEKQRYGYVGWTDGIARDNSGMARVLVMSNLYSRLFVTIIYRGEDRDK